MKRSDVYHACFSSFLVGANLMGILSAIVQARVGLAIFLFICCFASALGLVASLTKGGTNYHNN